MKFNYCNQWYTTGNGVVEILPDSFGFLRLASANYATSSDDIYICNWQIKKFNVLKLWSCDTCGFGKSRAITLLELFLPIKFPTSFKQT